jgi:Methyltransferase domain
MRPVRVLEIGSWEGRSALFFLNYFPASQLVCVDTFGGNIEHMRNPHFAALIPETEQRFDANVAAFTGRVEKIKGTSADVLPRLGIAGRRFNIVYVDATSGCQCLRRWRAGLADGCARGHRHFR